MQTILFILVAPTLILAATSVTQTGPEMADLMPRASEIIVSKSSKTEGARFKSSGPFPVKVSGKCEDAFGKWESGTAGFDACVAKNEEQRQEGQRGHIAPDLNKYKSIRRNETTATFNLGE